MNKKYLIACLRHGYDKKDNLIFWGKSSSGYYEDVTKAGLYDKKEAYNICEYGDDCPIPLKYIGLSEEQLSNMNYHKNLKLCVLRTDEICKYINNYKRITNNIYKLKMGEF